MSVNQIISDLPALIGIGVTSGLASSVLTAFLSPRIQHRFWIRQQRFDSRFSNLKELHRLSVETGQFFQNEDLVPLTHEVKAKAVALAYSWRAATQQTRFLFSEQATKDLAELDRAASAILLHREEQGQIVEVALYGEEKGQTIEEIVKQRLENLGKFLANERKVFEALS